jgi:hypothetical protein
MSQRRWRSQVRVRLPAYSLAGVLKFNILVAVDDRMEKGFFGRS